MSSIPSGSSTLEGKTPRSAVDSDRRWRGAWTHASLVKSLGSKGWTHLSYHLQENAVILIPALIFFALVLAMNWQLFVTPLIEDVDFAVNALQVQSARHMQELLGNYSRWGFHHPGPFFFYVFGLGEALFYDRLHLVPAPLNGEYLAELVFGTVCLFLAIHIFRVNIRTPLFPALAMVVTILFLNALDTAIPGSVLSIWPPYMVLPCFLLLAASCASVGAGNWRHVPLLAFSGMVMIHAHVAHLLFVTVLGFLALAIAIYREFKWGNPVQAFRAYRLHFAWAAGIVVLFLMPPAIDWAINHPNNIHQLRVYLQQHRGEHNSVRTAVLYTFSFFTFCPNPEIVSTWNVTLTDLLISNWPLRVYWSVFLFILVFAVVVSVGKKRKDHLFLVLIFGEIVLVTLLFLYWSWRITGRMYNFNGYFFFAIQLLAALALSAFLSNVAGRSLDRRAQVAMASASCALLLLTSLKNDYHSSPDVLRIVSSIKAKRIEAAMLVLPVPSDWGIAAGVASYMQRSGIYFCVAPDWQFMFGPAHTCKSNRHYYRVIFDENSSACQNPCSVLYSRPKLFVTGLP